MDKQHFKFLLKQAFNKGEQYGIYGESERTSDWKRANEIFDDFESWVENEIEALEYL